ncbi:methyltransferase domain-containing protein [Pararhodonellum marinum]|uniref:methyltransferase domain-containing protein n=1 Tax=Pararhodonellum marinum TaxID=2755358 RepID=UPI00188E7550|nr:methyltransferase domain-containing protein [Pararhodonellum marinum]
MSKFEKRSYQKELMDDLDCGGAELTQTLKELRIINRLLGGNHVTTNGLNQLFKLFPQKSYSIADVGCGGGDMIRVMHEWAKKRKLDCHFVGIDANPNIIAEAKQNLANLPNVSFETANVFNASFPSEKTDIVSCTLFTHHFTDDELGQIFGAFKSKARIGIVINDLHRHPLAYHSIKIITRLFSKSQMVKNDGPLSVLRSFKRDEIVNLLHKIGYDNVRIKWKWAFRWQIICYL